MVQFFHVKKYTAIVMNTDLDIEQTSQIKMVQLEILL